MKEIVSVGIQIPSTDIDFYELNDKVSLSDADIIVFSPIMSYSLYREDNSGYQGKTCYNENSSFSLKEDFTHWKRELNLALNNGKTVFIFLSKKEDFFVHTGQKQYSGTGRNQKTTNIVEPYHNYNFLPIGVNVQSVEGKKVTCQSILFRSFYDEFQKHIHFEAAISSNEIKEFSFTTKSKDRCLGTVLNVSKGSIVFIPIIDCDDESFWTPNGKTTKAGIEFGKRLLFHIIEIDKTLKSNTEKTPKPEWLNSDQYELKESIETKKAIQRNLENIKKIEGENIKLNDILIEQESLTDLLFEGGKALENAVIKALKILGYHAENYDDGVLELDQVIISPENDRFIGECEGKENKDIDISKFRQLQDALNEDFQREEIEEKAFGLLFGNPQRLINPNERTLDFTKKCKSGAEREKIGLIKTSDLFTIAKYLSENENESYKLECRKSIKSQLGHLICFPDIPIKKSKATKTASKNK